MTAQLFLESSSALPIVSFVLAFPFGSMCDPKEKEGTMRILARMLRRGSHGLTSMQIDEKMDGFGAEFGADVSLHSTLIHGEVIARNAQAFFDLVAGLVSGPEFCEEELGKLKRETECELLEILDSDRALAARAFRKTLFNGHPFGRKVSGDLKSIQKVDQEDLRQLHRKGFSHPSMMIGFCGDVNSFKAKQFSETIGSRLSQHPTISESPPPEPTMFSGRRLIFVDKPERTQTQMLMGCFGTSPHDKDHFPLLVANSVFGGTFTSRLMQEIRVKRGWSYGASSRLGFDKGRDTFVMSAAPSATDAADCLKLQLNLLEVWYEKGISQEELDFTKSYLCRSQAFEVDTPRKRMHQRMEIALYEWPSNYHEDYISSIKEVTLEQANQAIRNRIDPNNLVISVVGTFEEIGKAIQDSISNLQVVKVVQFDED